MKALLPFITLLVSEAVDAVQQVALSLKECVVVAPLGEQNSAIPLRLVVSVSFLARQRRNGSIQQNTRYGDMGQQIPERPRNVFTWKGDSPILTGATSMATE